MSSFFFPFFSFSFLIWLNQDGLQELKASKGRCPTREHRQSGLGQVWISPGVIECGCREVEFFDSDSSNNLMFSGSKTQL